MILQLGEKHLTESEFKESVVGVIVRLFQSPDKAIRIMLLELLPSVVGRLGKPLINDKIYPQLVFTFVYNPYENMSRVDHWIRRCFAGCS